MKKTTKISLTVISAIFFFSLGVCVQSLLPEPARELASPKAANFTNASRTPQAAVDKRLSGALKNCLSEDIKGTKISLQKAKVDGQQWSVVSIDCSGPRAEALYEALAPYSQEQYVKLTDGRKGFGRFFGGLYPPSQCIKHGSRLDRHDCLIRLDLGTVVIEALKP